MKGVEERISRTTEEICRAERGMPSAEIAEGDEDLRRSVVTIRSVNAAKCKCRSRTQSRGGWARLLRHFAMSEKLVSECERVQVMQRNGECQIVRIEVFIERNLTKMEWSKSVFRAEKGALRITR